LREAELTWFARRRKNNSGNVYEQMAENMLGWFMVSSVLKNSCKAVLLIAGGAAHKEIAM